MLLHLLEARRSLIDYSKCVLWNKIAGKCVKLIFFLTKKDLKIPSKERNKI